MVNSNTQLIKHASGMLLGLMSICAKGDIAALCISSLLGLATRGL